MGANDVFPTDVRPFDKCSTRCKFASPGGGQYGTANGLQKGGKDKEGA